MEKLIFFSIIIPTYERTQDLITTLTELKKQSYKNFEVVVCSAGSKKTYNRLKNFRSVFKLKNIYHSKPSRTAQRNQACKEASGKYFVFIDDHFLAHTDMLKNYAEYIQSKDRPVHLIRGGVLYIPTQLKILDSDIDHCIRYKSSAFQDPFQMSITNNLCVSREAFESAGGFDEDFKTYGFEDSELGARIKACGFRFHYLRTAFGGIFNSSSGNSPDYYKKFIETGCSARLLYQKNKWLGMRAGYHPVNLFLARLLLFFGVLEREIKLAQSGMPVTASRQFNLFLYGMISRSK